MIQRGISYSDYNVHYNRVVRDFHCEFNKLGVYFPLLKDILRSLFGKIYNLLTSTKIKYVSLHANTHTRAHTHTHTNTNKSKHTIGIPTDIFMRIKMHFSHVSTSKSWKSRHKSGGYSVVKCCHRDSEVPVSSLTDDIVFRPSAILFSHLSTYTFQKNVQTWLKKNT